MLEQVELKIKELQAQIHEIQDAHNKLRSHYYEFVKATIQTFKEINEEEQLDLNYLVQL